MRSLSYNLFACVIIFMIPCFSTAQADYPWLRTGDQLYDKSQYSDAETSYRKSIELNKSKPAASFNLGNTIYQQNRLPEAITEYKKAIEATDDPALRAKAHYNLGNAYFQNQQFAESIKNYKETLKVNPEDLDAKKNLMLAMRQLQQQQQQQNQNQDQQQQEEEQDQEKKEEQQQNQQEQQQQQNQQKQQEQKQNINKEEANEILKAIEREDQRVQEKLKKVSGKSAPPVKDW